MATGFYSITLSQTKSATRYSDSVRAELLARAGIEHALAQLREGVFKRTENVSDAWYGVDYLHGAKKRISFAANMAQNGRDDDGDGNIDNKEEMSLPFSMALGSTVAPVSDRFTVNVSDAASKINVNAGDNLAVMLDNLCRAIGPPLLAAEPDALQPRRWYLEGATTGNYDNGMNTEDTDQNPALYYWLYDESGKLTWDGLKKLGTGIPKAKSDGTALYGDGYAIAGYRARNGRFKNLEDVRNALTYVERNGNKIPDHPLEQLEVDVKFASLRDYITIDSWVDTNTVCVGKFEWLSGGSSSSYTIAIDRDKSWVVDDKVNDPDNTRGSLRGCYVSIVNGHGSGQFRRIKTNGVDWIELEEGFVVAPGPTSSYMIIAKPDAKPDPYDPDSGVAPDRLAFAPDGDLVDDPLIDYVVRPLCIHRAPVNINTASDKVLVALFMGINVQHGHPMSIATDVDRQKLVPLILKSPPAGAGDTDWKTQEYTNRGMEPYLLTLRGLKRIPADSGQLAFDCSIDPIRSALKSKDPDINLDYINNFGRMDPKGNPDMMSEAHELALRVISARQRKINTATNEFVGSDLDPLTIDPKTGSKGYERGAFKSWDDFYFRVVRPWDDAEARYNDPKKISVARMIMAHFNSNTDILKFNPNIEWIDRWGRNFTEMEPVMIFDDGANEPKWVDYTPWPAGAASDGMWNVSLVNAGKRRGAYYTRSMRYKSEELLDKTDMNRSTTEFSFDSAGVFEIQSTGQVMSRRDLQAERKIVALVKLYDVWRESTQAQFVRGVFSEAENGAATTWNVKGAHHDGDFAGRITRDARNGTAGGTPKRLTLDTLPEPLTPLRAKFNSPTAIQDIVDTQQPDGRDAWGRGKVKGQPDVIANRVMPSYYDGQIVLATNTSAFNAAGDDDDTFLASFDGDLDTPTAVGNGREQAKTPTNKEIRVLDTFGLLGVLNDKEIDFDPKGALPGNLGGGIAYDFFAVKAANEVMRALNPEKYWENVTCRMGDLRPDGVFMGNVGISGKDATLKYLTEKNWPLSTAKEGTISMWFKPTWHVTDGQEHEFFSAVGIGDGYTARGNHLRKQGRFTGIIRFGVSGSSNGGGGGNSNDLACHSEDSSDWDMIADMHGGIRSVPATQRVSPSFRTQPFRWSFTGMTMKYGVKLKTWPYPGTSHDTGADEVGYYATGGATNARNEDNAKEVLRPFICTSRAPEGKNWTAATLHTKVTGSPMGTPDIGKSGSSICQEAAWPWADGATKNQWIFGANNLNCAINKWLYRSSPIDGTQAVVDEYKLSKKHWDTDRIAEEMTTSRYYLPRDPRNPAECPLFTSQSLLQSLKGSERTASDEEVTVARVSWNCFTPRFLYELRELQSQRKRIENFGDTGSAATSKQVQYRGPFDYIQYNWDILPRASASDPRKGEAQLPGNEQMMVSANAKTVPILFVDRPSPDCYYPARQPHATRGVEVELVQDSDGKADSGDETVLGKTFVDPDENNTVGSAQKPVRVKTSQLRYRVRFRYPIDPLLAGIYGESSETVVPQNHYMLDTPVFDDISVTYFTRPRVLTYREVNE